MLDDLIARPLDEGDVLSNANTVIYMGKTRTAINSAVVYIRQASRECL